MTTITKDEHAQTEADRELTLDDVMDELDAAREDRELIKEQLEEVIEKLTNLGLDRE